MNKVQSESQKNCSKSLSNIHKSRDASSVNSGSFVTSSSSDNCVPDNDQLPVPENKSLNLPLNSDQQKPAEISHVKMNGCDDKSESSSLSSIGLSNYLDQARKEIWTKKLQIQSTISEYDRKIQSLQKEISHPQEVPHAERGMTERCNLLVEDKGLETKKLSSVLKKYSCAVPSEPSSTSSFEKNYEEAYHPNNQVSSNDAVLKSSYSKYKCSNTEEEDLANNIPDLLQKNSHSGEISQKLQEKQKELEKEIEICQENEAKLKRICKEKDEALKQLLKERENFNKCKEAEMKKFEAEMGEKQRQFRQEKEAFYKLQKSSRENSTKKTRDELNALRQEVEKLQEELKQQNKRHVSEIRKLKNRLDASEKEKSSIKLDNTRLQEENQDLITALKARMKKKPEISVKESVNNDKKNEKPEKEIETENSVKENLLETDKKSNQASLKSTAEKKKKPKALAGIENRYHAHENSSENKMISSSTETDYLVDKHKTHDPDEHLTDSKEVQNSPVNSSRTIARNGFESHKMNSSVLSEDDLMKTVEKKSFLADLYERSHNYKYITDLEDTETAATNLSVSNENTESEFEEIDYNNKVERMYRNGEKIIRFNSGTRKFISADGQTTKFYFYNGDTKEILPDKKEITKFVNGVTETKFPNGIEITEFPNGQVQKLYPNGTKEVKTPDGTISSSYPDGSEEFRKADGTTIRIGADGTETRLLPNGQTEIRTATYRRRVFPDGSVKTAYINGRVETRFSNGRIRIKDKDRKLIVDTKYLPVLRG